VGAGEAVGKLPGNIDPRGVPVSINAGCATGSKAVPKRIVAKLAAASPVLDNIRRNTVRYRGETFRGRGICFLQEC
jgi:hypothetical protein